MNQLKLKNSELLKIGFEKYKTNSDELNPSRNCFKIETLNGYFYYNPDEKDYVWYHKTIIGDVSNYVHLDITERPELFVLLSCFRAKYNLVL